MSTSRRTLLAAAAGFPLAQTTLPANAPATLRYDLGLTVIHEGWDGNKCYVHSRAGAIPPFTGGNQSRFPIVVRTFAVLISAGRGRGRCPTQVFSDAVWVLESRWRLAISRRNGMLRQPVCWAQERRSGTRTTNSTEPRRVTRFMRFTIRGGARGQPGSRSSFPHCHNSRIVAPAVRSGLTCPVAMYCCQFIFARSRPLRIIA